MEPDFGADVPRHHGGDSYVIGGGARSASDKLFQHNGNGTVHISDFYASGHRQAVPRLRQLHQPLRAPRRGRQRAAAVNAKYVVGINTNWGDTATLTRVVVQSSSGIHICAEYTGVAKGSEPKYLGDGMGDGHCNFKSSASRTSRRSQTPARSVWTARHMSRRRPVHMLRVRVGAGHCT
ncbi:hypothetical protein GCM10020218_019550 [Dactylosporangium vinaceum]